MRATGLMRRNGVGDITLLVEEGISGLLLRRQSKKWMQASSIEDVRAFTSKFLGEDFRTTEEVNFGNFTNFVNLVKFKPAK